MRWRSGKLFPDSALVQKRGRLRDAKDLKAYLFQMARNEARTLLKQRVRHSRQARAGDWLIGNGTDHELRDQLTWALSALPEKQRIAIVLKMYRGQTFLEIGQMLGVSQNTVASQYRYGLAKLRTLLGNVNYE